VERDFIALCQLLHVNGLDLSHCGVTGSLLIGVQQASSDIDLVCYNLDVFQHCRAIVRELITRDVLQELSDTDWQQSYQRRDCELSFADYLWHERRKFNKAVINGRKFDLNLINPSSAPVNHYQKCGAITLQCRVLNDTAAFAYPAEFIIDHPHIHSVVSFTATYTGQAVNGELIEIAGVVEQDAHGIKRIVIGSSREAHGEYIKVIRCLT
jgi:predicted nucleotidyltransferase